MSTPATWAMFCANTKMRANSQDTLYFADNINRKAFFAGKAITINGSKQITGLSYQRLENGSYKMRVPAPRQAVYECDYMIFRNTAHENREIYAFIDDVQYVNEEMCEVYFTEDAFQTWINDATFYKSYVTRRTLSTDQLFSHENDIPDIFTGDYHTMLKQDISGVQGTHAQYAVLCLSMPLYMDGDTIEKAIYNRGGLNGDKPENFVYYIANIDQTSGMEALFNLITHVVSSETYGSAFLAFFMCPEICLPDSVCTYADAGTPVAMVAPGGTISLTGWTPVYGYLATYKYDNFFINWSTIKSVLFDGYIPKNKKMYNAPYWKLRIKNNSGQMMELLPQYLINKDEAVPQTEANMVFGGQIVGVFSQYPFVALFPSYDGSERNTSYKLTLVTPPQLPVKSDAFLAWYQQMKLAMPMMIARGVSTAITTVAKSPLNPKSAALSLGTNAVSGLLDIAEGAYYAAHSAPTVSGETSADFSTLALQDDHFTIEILSISSGEAKICDDFLTARGYAIGHTVSPENGSYYNLNNRPSFSYIQTEGLTVGGDIPAYARDIISAAYNRGVRVWNPAHFLDYSYDNSLT